VDQRDTVVRLFLAASTWVPVPLVPPPCLRLPCQGSGFCAYSTATPPLTPTTTTALILQLDFLRAGCRLLAHPGTAYIPAVGTWRLIRRAIHPRSPGPGTCSRCSLALAAAAGSIQQPRAFVKSYLILPASAVAVRFDSRNNTRVPSLLPCVCCRPPRPSFPQLKPCGSPVRSSVPFLSWLSLFLSPLCFSHASRPPSRWPPPCRSS
jgi:hypothetical protein